MFVEKKVFDPNLEGKAVYLQAHETKVENGLYLVNIAEGEHLALINHRGDMEDFHVSYFEDERNKLQVIEPPHIEPGNKIKRMRGYTTNLRSAEEVREETEILISVLKEHIGSIPLREIIKKMQSQGLKHWNNKNATSYIKSAMRNGYPIVKPEYGHYAYDWSGKNG